MPKPELLETFPNPYGDRTYEIYMETTEFTSLCPLGGIETDAAELRLLEGGGAGFRDDPDYVPAGRAVSGAQEPEAVFLEFPERRHFLRAGGEPDFG